MLADMIESFSIHPKVLKATIVFSSSYSTLLLSERYCGRTFDKISLAALGLSSSISFQACINKEGCGSVHPITRTMTASMMNSFFISLIIWMQNYCLFIIYASLFLRFLLLSPSLSATFFFGCFCLSVSLSDF